MIQRWDDLTPAEQQRYLTAEELRAQLAAVTADSDAAVSALRLTRAAQGQHTGVFMRLDAYQDLLSQIATLEEQVKALRVQVSTRAETAEARLLALQVDRSKAVKLRDETDNVIWALKPADVPGAINWGDLGVREVQEVIDDERRWYRVIIEEADPSNPALHAAVTAGLVALGWPADDIEIETAW